MLLSELIKYCETMMHTFGDNQICKIITGPQEQYKPVDITFELSKTGWIKKRTVSEDEEITVKRRATVFKLKMDEDLQ